MRNKVPLVSQIPLCISFKEMTLHSLDVDLLCVYVLPVHGGKEMKRCLGKHAPHSTANEGKMEEKPFK